MNALKRYAREISIEFCVASTCYFDSTPFPKAPLRGSLKKCKNFVICSHFGGNTPPLYPFPRICLMFRSRAQGEGETCANNPGGGHFDKQILKRSGIVTLKSWQALNAKFL